ncbi:L,D-transpeptidase family protein [Aliiroseovarius marinus]|uniref:L,D-transpeptidase family protein n=1 Tax=Aliiroseovarius marinus TaxID=2500159 RepID=UPI003D7E0481
MKRVLAACLALSVALLMSCGPKRHEYTGPEVTRIVVNKSARKMYLLHHADVLKAYDIELGFAPTGAKQFEGDGRTPEGRYLIDRRNPRSKFYLSLGISYPNQNDIDFAKSQGRKPGGDIFIHGDRRKQDPNGPDWTAGCISVDNKEMIEIYTMVRVGTIIDINP